MKYFTPKNKITFFILFTLLTLTLITALLYSPSSFADAEIYRTVDAKNNGRVATNPSQWRIDNDGLSTYDLEALQDQEHIHRQGMSNKPCLVKFTVLGVDDRPDEGDFGPVAGSEGLIAQYAPANNNLGHWNIRIEGQDMSEGDAKVAARQAMVTLARAFHTETLPNPAYQGEAKTCNK